MKKPKNICNLFVVIALALILFSCQRSAVKSPQAETPGASVTDRGFDPLELADDNLNIPKQYPQPGEIVGSTVVNKENISVTESTQLQIEDLPDSVDSLNNQAYRIQIFSTKVYGEARHSVKIAEEVFDRPIFVDYEVPYYKIRVGNFDDRNSAEDYQMKAKAAGYTNAWVVIVNVNVKETSPLYDDELMLPVVDDSLMVEDTDSTDENSNDEN